MMSGCFPFRGRKSKRQNPMKTKEVHPDHHNHLPQEAMKTITLSDEDQEDKESPNLKEEDQEEEVQSVRAPSTGSSSSQPLTSPTSWQSDQKKPVDSPARCITLYVGAEREVYKVPERFREYKSFMELLEEAEKRGREREKSKEITEDLGDVVLLDFVTVESFLKVKGCLEWKEREKKAKEDSYYDPLWVKYFSIKEKKDSN